MGFFFKKVSGVFWSFLGLGGIAVIFRFQRYLVIFLSLGVFWSFLGLGGYFGFFFFVEVS